jgi:hypothetical protein
MEELQVLEESLRVPDLYFQMVSYSQYFSLFPWLTSFV